MNIQDKSVKMDLCTNKIPSDLYDKDNDQKDTKDNNTLKDNTLKDNDLADNTILIVLGPSSAGKSTHIYNEYLSKKEIPVLIDYELLDKNIQYELSKGNLSQKQVIVHFNSFCVYKNNKKNYNSNANFHKSETIKFLLDDQNIKKRLKVDIIIINRDVLINRIINRNHVEPLLRPHMKGQYPRLSIMRLLKRVDINYETNKWIALWTSEGVHFRLIAGDNN